MTSKLLKAAALPLVLALLGAILVGWARMTPAHTDEAAYRAAIEVVSDRAMNADLKDTSPLSNAFFAARDRYETAKWPLIDTGYSLLAWAALCGVWRLVARGRSPTALLRPSRAWRGLLGLSAAGLAMLAVGDWEFEMRQLVREQLPWWADSIIIGIVEGWVLLAIITPVVLALVLGPLARRHGPPPSLLAFPGGVTLRNVVVGLLYAAPILLSAYLAIQFAEPGGWATSMGAATLCWLFLNGRALLSGASQPPIVATPAMASS